MTDWVNVYSQRLGALGSSSSHGGGLGAPFLFEHQRGCCRVAKEHYVTLHRDHRRVQMRSSSSLWQQYSSWAEGQQGGRRRMPHRSWARVAFQGRGLHQVVPPDFCVLPHPCSPSFSRIDQCVERCRRPVEPKTLQSHTSLTRNDSQDVLPWRERGAL